MNNWLLSGAAVGADLLFDKCAKEVGHFRTHFSFKGHNVACSENVVILNENQLHLADIYLQQANIYLKRKWPTTNPFTNCLLERNYYQIKDSNKIYAITFRESNGHIKGGTAWAVMMGILRGMTEIYVFDQNTNNWYSFKNFDKEKNIIEWNIIPYAPYPSNKYTGIGSRDLRPNGIDAIRYLYNLREIK